VGRDHKNLWVDSLWGIVAIDGMFENLGTVVCLDLVFLERVS
jgi:hypothetical protein